MAACINWADIILLTGDLTHFGGADQADLVLSKLRAFDKRILAVAGNCDYPEVEQYLRRNELSLHGVVKEIDGIGFLGMGGSLPCPGKTPNEMGEYAIRDLLNGAVEAWSGQLPLILVSHQPPFGTKADDLGEGRHVGSRELRSFIERRRPIACFTGHIHEGRGVDRIGETWVANPGPAFGEHAARTDSASMPLRVEIASCRAR